MVTPTRGSLVYARDGALLGAVEEIRGDYFKLDKQLSLDYWLPVGCLESARGDVLTTRFPKADLDDYRVEPGSL